MKQRITAEQLAELTRGQEIELRKRWDPQTYDVVLYNGSKTIIEVSHGCISEYATEDGFITGVEKEDCLPLLSIGQMVGLLYLTAEGRWTVSRIFNTLAGEQCDRLWDVVKTFLAANTCKLKVEVCKVKGE